MIPRPAPDDHPGSESGTMRPAAAVPGPEPGTRTVIGPCCQTREYGTGRGAADPAASLGASQAWQRNFPRQAFHPHS
eukprot:25329-Hanusia_phi.AAC.1